MSRESQLQQKVQKFLKKALPRGARIRKLADQYTRGYPDLQVMFTNHAGHLCVLEIELKREGGSIQPIQDAEARSMKRASASASHGKYLWVFAWSVEDVKTALDFLESDTQGGEDASSSVSKNARETDGGHVPV